MRRAVLLPLLLVSRLAPGAPPATPGTAAKAPAKAKPATTRAVPPGKHRPVTVTRVAPTDVVAGDEVTVTGTGFDQGTVLLLESHSPEVIERSDTKLVFRIPPEERPAAWAAPLYLVTPGQRVVPANVKLQVLPKSSRVAQKPATQLITPYVLQTVVALSKAQEKSWSIDVAGARALRILVESSEGDCEVRLEPEGGSPIIRATQGRTLSFEAELRTLKGADGKPATKISLVVANDAEKAVPVRVSVQRVDRSPIQAAP